MSREISLDVVLRLIGEDVPARLVEHMRMVDNATEISKTKIAGYSREYARSQRYVENALKAVGVPQKEAHEAALAFARDHTTLSERMKTELERQAAGRKEVTKAAQEDVELGIKQLATREAAERETFAEGVRLAAAAQAQKKAMIEEDVALGAQAVATQKQRQKEAYDLQVSQLRVSISAYDRSAQAAFRLSSALRQISIMSYVTMMVFTRMTERAWAQEDAQKRLNEVIKEYGAGSKEAAEAAKDYERSQIRATWADAQFGISVALTAGNLAAMIAVQLIQHKASVATIALRALETKVALAQATALGIATGAQAGETIAKGVAIPVQQAKIAQDITETIGLYAKAKALALTSLAGIPFIGWAALALAGGMAVGAGLAAMKVKEQREAAEVKKAQRGAIITRGGIIEVERGEEVKPAKERGAFPLPSLVPMPERGRREVPGAQVGLLGMRRVERTGLAVVHAEERITRAPKGEGGDVNVNIGRVELDPEGRDVGAFARQLGVMIKAVRPEIY